ncbi:hypothetical protein Patl1_03478 [Pistacia atlantica]|uniref:Uncharacterized protein n=1 Tax=Pistacia atlantica TaxID=434234 RepID=A0ACC1C7P9_9ROSI|nr:hypothetical protein Patl1_03478 [Pistacia atlantica]
MTKHKQQEKEREEGYRLRRKKVDGGGERFGGKMDADGGKVVDWWESVDSPRHITQIEESTSNKPPRFRPNAKSAVWQHFKKIYNCKTNKIEGTKCMYCEKTFTYGVANGTSSMRKHLTSCKKFPQNVDNSQTLLSFKTTQRMEGKLVRFVLGDLIKKSVGSCLLK